MEQKRLVKVSKYLSKHLRHQPQRLGIKLDAGGWVRVADLLAACARNGFAITRAELDEVVARNDKQRFSFDATGARLRANQGHSIVIDLQLEATMPPPALYHGTGSQNEEAILRAGLVKMQRHHVHLARDPETALRVGARHGAPIVFEIAAARMQAAGFAFYVAANGVWLVHSVPPEFLRKL